MTPPLIVFDLDGTLIDSAPDLAAAANRMLDETGRPPLALETVRRFIGNGAPKLVERVLAETGMDPSEQDTRLERFLAFYAAHPADATEVYPGVRAALAALDAAGHPMAICTNKPEAPARSVLDALDLGPFAAVVGGDTLPVRKPDPAPLHAAIAAAGGGAAIYVGDSEIDAETARAAGLPFALFTEGYRKCAVSEMPHDAAFSDFAELPGIVARLG